MTNICKYLLETFFMFAVPVVALSMLDDIFIEDAKVFPEYICYAMFFLATINAIQFWSYVKKTCPIQWSALLRRSLPTKETSSFPVRRLSVVLALMIVYVFTMETVGFYFTGFLFFFLILLILDQKKQSVVRIGKKIGYALIFMGIIYLLFSMMLGMTIPSGILC